MLSTVASDGQPQAFRVEVKVEDTGTGLLATVSYPDGKPSFTSNGAATKEKLANSEASSQGMQDSSVQDADLGSAASFSVSPGVILAAVVGIAVLAVAVVGIVRLQSRGSKKPGAHAVGEAKLSPRASRPMRAVDADGPKKPADSPAPEDVASSEEKSPSDDSGAW